MVSKLPPFFFPHTILSQFSCKGKIKNQNRAYSGLIFPWILVLTKCIYVYIAYIYADFMAVSVPMLETVQYGEITLCSSLTGFKYYLRHIELEWTKQQSHYLWEVKSTYEQIYTENSKLLDTKKMVLELLIWTGFKPVAGFLCSTVEELMLLLASFSAYTLLNFSVSVSCVRRSYAHVFFSTIDYSLVLSKLELN